MPLNLDSQDTIALLAALGLFFWQIYKRESFRHVARYARWGSTAVFFAIAIFWSVYQYFIWQADGFTRLFLPPHQSITYFLGYIVSRLLGSLVIALIISLLFQFAASFFNRRLGERFFEQEEIHLCGMGILLCGYPGLFVYIPLVLLAGLSLSVYYTLAKKGRAPLYYFWLPAVIFAILIKYLFISPTLLNLFKL